MSEHFAVDKYMKERLPLIATGPPPLAPLPVPGGYWSGTVPDYVTQYPVIRWEPYSEDRDNQPLGLIEPMSYTPRYLVMVMDTTGDYMAVYRYGMRIFKVLSDVEANKVYNLDGDIWTVHSCRRERPVRPYYERKGETRFNHYGGIYQFFIDRET